MNSPILATAHIVDDWFSTNLAPVFLHLKSLGIDNIVRFDFLSSPPSALAARALELLYALGGLDESGQLTRPLGVNMAEFPVDPMLSKMASSSPI